MSFRKETSIAFDTLGCAKNSVDTEKMQRSLMLAGYTIKENTENADVIILNTCAFIEAAAQESIDTFFEYNKWYPDAKIVVVGCLVSRYTDLPKAMKEADCFISCKDEGKIVDIIDELTSSQPNEETTNIKKCRNLLNSSSYAYVKISDGCNRKCAYCTIPSIRGKYQSSKYSTIYKDVERATKGSVSEVVLVAQDCGVWGCDFQNERNLAWLLNTLCSDFSDISFRLLYIQPDAITDELLDTFVKNDNLINYFDIPMQHCNKNILKAMNRNGDAKTFLSLIQKIRSMCNESIIRTTLIVGFPGETDNDFNELYNFVEDAQFDYLGVFEFSPEEGTKAFSMDSQVDRDTKSERLNTIRDLGDRMSIQRIDSMIGSKTSIVVEGKEDHRTYGRAWFQAPEVDGVVFLEKDKDYEIGEKINVEITNTELYDLVAKEI